MRAPGWNRTSDPDARNVVLFSAELRGRSGSGGIRTLSADTCFTDRPDSPTSARSRVTERSRTATTGATIQRSTVELRPQCPNEVSNLGPPRCERGALPLSYPGFVAGVRFERPLRIMTPVWYQLHYTRSAARRNRTHRSPDQESGARPSGASGIARKARDSNPPRACHPVRRFRRRSSTNRSPSIARRDGDSNPGHPRGCYTLSRRAPRPAGLSPCRTPETIRTSDTRIRSPVL